MSGVRYDFLTLVSCTGTEHFIQSWWSGFDRLRLDCKIFIMPVYVDKRYVDEDKNGSSESLIRL